MNEKVNKLLAEMDAEIMAKVDAKAIEKDSEIKAKAQEAYDAVVKDCIAEIKADVEKEYSIARKYLEDLREPEPVVEEAPIANEAPVEGVKVEEQVNPAHVEGNNLL